MLINKLRDISSFGNMRNKHIIRSIVFFAWDNVKQKYKNKIEFGETHKFDKQPK